MKIASPSWRSSRRIDENRLPVLARTVTARQKSPPVDENLRAVDESANNLARGHLRRGVNAGAIVPAGVLR
jgi:hypothetical protein